MFKNQVISRFNKAATSYDKFSITQKKSAKLLARTLHLNFPNFNPKTILDLGTGTGSLAQEMLNFYPNANYCLNDCASNMLKECQKKFFGLPNFSYLECDMKEIPDQSYDLVMSNFSLQWLDDNGVTINKLTKNCKAFVFTYVLQDTFKEWYKVLKDYNITTKPNNFLNQKQLEEICINTGTKCIYFTKDYPLKFESYASFANYLKLLGASASLNNVSISNLKKFLKQNKKITTSYRVFFALFINE